MIACRFRPTTTALVLIILFAALVQASNQGSDSFDAGDLSWTSTGEEFSTMLAYSQCGPMVRVPPEGVQYSRTPGVLTGFEAGSPMANTHCSAMPQAFQQPVPRSRPIPIQHHRTDYYAQYATESKRFAEEQDMFDPTPLPSSSAPATTEQDRRYVLGTMNSMQNNADLGKAQMDASFYDSCFDQFMQGRAAPANAAADFASSYQESHGFLATAQQQDETAQHLAEDLEQLFPEFNEPRRTVQQLLPASDYEAQQPLCATETPQHLSIENLGNHNLHMTPQPMGHTQNWIGQATAARHIHIPRLDTGHLAVPNFPDAHFSPSSVSSAASSAGRSPRRTREEMVLGAIKCGQCDAAFHTPGDLTHHLRSHAPYHSRTHVCAQCDKRFQYKKDLARHLPRHDPNRPRFYCRFAGCKYHVRGFGRQDHLDRHVTTQHRMEVGG